MKEILDGFSVIGIIGLAKNAGKTTTLNKIIDLYPRTAIGLTSIGLDGERVDQVTFLPKPSIFVRPGMVVATSLMCLESSHVSWNLIEATSFFTALGQIMIVDIQSEGTMVIAGPTSNRELNSIIQLMKKRCEKVVIDGAFNRMTFSNIEQMEGIVLASGASYSHDLEETLKQSCNLINLFSAKKTDDVIDKKADIAVINQYGIVTHEAKRIEMLETMINASKEHIKAIYIHGAITAKWMDTLIETGLKSYTLIIDNPSKWMASQRHFQALKHFNITIEVITPYPIIMVTVNPFSPDGAHYDAQTMMKRFKDEIHLPIYNVMEADTT